MTRVTEIARYDNAFEAHRIASLLLEAGIEAEVDNGHSGGLFSHISGIGIRVVVAEEDRARAEAVLAEVLPAPASDLDEDLDGADEDPFDDAGSPDGAGVAASPERAATAVAADDGNAATRDEAGAVLEPWPAAKAERWTRQLYNMAIGALLLLVVYAPVGLVLLVYVVVKCVDPPYGVLDAPLARRRLRWARVAAGVGAALVVAAALVYGWGLRIGS